MQTIKGYCLIRPIEVEQVTPSGIILGVVEEQSKLVRDMFPDHGIVVSENTGGEVSVGDEVIYKRWGAQPVGEFLRVNIIDVMCKVEDGI